MKTFKVTFTEINFIGEFERRTETVEAESNDCTDITISLYLKDIKKVQAFHQIVEL